MRQFNAAALLTIVVACWPVPATGTDAGADYSTLYDTRTLVADKPRYQRRLTELLQQGIRPALTDTQRRSLGQVQLRFPLPRGGDHPLNFMAYADGREGFVVLPVLSLKFLEDLATAYAWLHVSGHSLETIDEYVTMLRFQSPGDFPGNRYPPPLDALRVPAGALNDSRVDDLSLRFRNTAYAFVLLHELGHLHLEHRGYGGISRATARANESAADRFALEALERADTIPMGAILYFQAQAYSQPNRGQFASEAAWERFLANDATHPVTAERLQSMARYLGGAAGRASAPAERTTLRFIATRLAGIAETLSDAHIQRCMAVVGRRTDLSSLQPRRAGTGYSPLQQWCGQR